MVSCDKEGFGGVFLIVLMRVGDIVLICKGISLVHIR